MKPATIRLAALGLLGAVAALAGAGGRVTRTSAALGVPGRVNAAPSIAAIGQRVVVVWGASAPGGVTDVYAAVSRDGGRRFVAPVRVNDVEGDASVGGEQPPHVVLVPRPDGEPSIVVVWTAKQRGGTRILTARSDDGGTSFGHASPVPGGEATGNRGWESIAADGNGHVVSVWLDHRELAASATEQKTPMQHEGHDHASGGKPPADGAARAQLSKLYFSRLGDAGDRRGESAGRAIAAGVCYCCKTAVAAAADGSVYAAWRHVYPGNIRDIAFTMSKDAGRTFSAPLRVSDDRWVLDGCPENGPALALDSRQRIHVVWPTLVSQSAPDAEPTLQLFYAVSNDGRGFSPRRRLPTSGLPRHVQLAIAPDDSLVVVWEEQTSSTRRVVVGRARGARQFTRQTVSGVGPAVYPAVASAGASTVIAWTTMATEPSMIEVARFDD